MSAIWKKGHEVEAQWTDKCWYPAIIKEVTEKGYLVEYPQYGVVESADNIRPRPENKSKNESVVVDYNEAKKKDKNESVTIPKKKKKIIEKKRFKKKKFKKKNHDKVISRKKSVIKPKSTDIHDSMSPIIKRSEKRSPKKKKNSKKKDKTNNQTCKTQKVNQRS